MQNKVKRGTGPTRTLNKGLLQTALILGLIVPLLSGCAEMLLGGIAAGTMVVHERRDSRTILDDEYIEHQAIQLLADNPDIDKYSRISITSYNHLALLTGQAETQAVSDRFARLVAHLPKVEKVINEVTIGPPESFARESKDALITSRVKLALTKMDVPGFSANHVKVVTEAGAVFLMGLVYPWEGDAAAEKARYVSGVTKVVKVFKYIEP
ncbi:MAG: BON domain-containing protein [Candidatus Thiosymbion ectosymbiont of Robbea hypermnestra]|nr:BON domain-containing protein [Candidatus Thiosymbion ectosymbiont of Robbea hypermnestra]